jgi:hypothetical protein
MLPFQRITPALAALLIGLPSLLGAQWPSELTVGARVQARLPEAQYQPDARRGHLLRGRIAALADDTLYLAVTDSVGPLALPRPLIQRLELSRGVPSRGVSALREGVTMGLVGAATGLIAFSLLDEPNDADAGDVALVYGGISFGVGAILGALFPKERWGRVRLGD